MRKLPLFLFIALVGAFVLMLLHKSQPVNPGTADANPFPAITVTSMDGGKPWNASLFKNSITLVNFYASWCMPCAAEMPELAALKKQFPSLQMVGVAWNDDPAQLKQWLKKNGDPFTTHWLDKNGDATIELGIKGIPESFIVDHRGNIRYRLSGPVTEQVRDGQLNDVLKAVYKEMALDDSNL